jgi:glycerol-3-phosphate dehydrogenase (NAD(P)+)
MLLAGISDEGSPAKELLFRGNKLMDEKKFPPIAILGAGSWGTALALTLARRGQEVRMWTIEEDQPEIMQKERINNRYLPGQPFPPSLIIKRDIADAVHGLDDILVAVPSVGFRTTLGLLKPLIQPSTRILWATKGLDEDTGRLLQEVADEILGKNRSYAVLAGPSFAREVGAGLPTAVAIASNDPQFAKDLIDRFNSHFFRVYHSKDMIGLQVGSVVKNVLAIATGISDGMGFGANARCAIITRGLSEMCRLGIAMGAHLETFMGLAGVGDLVLTCTDDQSRNRRYGLALGRGESSQQAEKAINQVIEGKRNAELLVALARKLKLDLPICEMVWYIVSGKFTPKQAMENLLAREPGDE